MEGPEIDPNFEPISRVRSNTWPLRPQEFTTKSEPTPPSEEDRIDEQPGEEEAEIETIEEDKIPKDPLGLSGGKKTGSRRNAWGNLSYADLITKAIQSSPEQRLTLSQIYDWMVQNVPYFKDKGDSNSSAGWKNSIRHNLSLHSRFMRIQNEGTGKSSWWVINPDAKPGKSPRRRATSMDTKAYEKKRGRVKKKVEQLRQALEGSPASSDGWVDSPLHHQLSPEHFRPRASSNASSCGRLSPISAVYEPDLHENQVPPMSPIPWNDMGSSSNLSAPFNNSGQDRFADSLTDSMADMMKLEPGNMSPCMSAFTGDQFDAMNGGGGSRNSPMPPTFTTLTNVPNVSSFNNVGQTLGQFGPQPTSQQSNGYNNLQFGSNLPAPPPYPETLRSSPQHNIISTTIQNGQMSETREFLDLDELNSSMGLYQPEPIMGDNPMLSTTGLGMQNQGRNLDFTLNNHSAFRNTNSLNVVQQQQQPSQQPQRSPQLQRAVQSQQQQHAPVNRVGLSVGTDNSLLRQALQQPQTKQLQVPRISGSPTSLQMNTSNFMGNVANVNTVNMQQQQQMGGQLQMFPNDIDLTLDSLQAEGIECDVDQVIRQELSIDGNLDFTFDQLQQNFPNSNTNLVQ